jgi:hypothetical protein
VVADSAATASDLSAVLDFASVLLWQAMIAGTLFYFRKEIRQIFQKLATLKVVGLEFTLQEAAPDLEPSPQVAAKAVSVLAGGFLSPEGISEVVRLSGVPGSEEPVLRSLLIFATQQQRTWLVATRTRLMCLLDDETTRASGSIVQWVLGKEQATPITARATRPMSGGISIGPRKSWLYSTRLFGSPEEIENAVRELIGVTSKQ